MVWILCVMPSSNSFQASSSSGPSRAESVTGRMNLGLGILGCFLQLRPRREAEMMPLLVRQDDPSVHIQPVDLEGRIEGMEQGRVIPVAQILGI